MHQSNVLSANTNLNSQELLHLKAAAYDCHRQIQYLTQLQLPQIERAIAECEKELEQTASLAPDPKTK